MNRDPVVRSPAAACRAASSASLVFPIPPGRERDQSHAVAPDQSLARPYRLVRGPPAGSAAPAGRPARSPRVGPAAPRPRTVNRSVSSTARSFGDQVAQLGGLGERPVGDSALRPDPGEHLRQPRIAVVGRGLDVDQPRQPGRQPVLVLEPGNLLAGRDPAVAPPVDGDEDLALRQVGPVHLAGGCDRAPSSNIAGVSRSRVTASRTACRSAASSCQRRAHEHPQPPIGRVDDPGLAHTAPPIACLISLLLCLSWSCVPAIHINAKFGAHP